MNIKKRTRKGFTLIELIIVLAIFSLIMTLVMSFIDPVSRLMKKTSIKERTISYVDNIGEYVDNSLRYAKFVQICESSYFGIGHPELDPLNGASAADSDDAYAISESATVSKFIDAIFDSARNAQGEPLNGEVRVLQFINEDVGTLKSGMVYESSYDFTVGDPKDADATKRATKISERYRRQPVINSEHVENYDYYFKLGFWNLQPIHDLDNYTVPVTGDAIDPGNGNYFSKLVRMDNSTGNIGPLPTNIQSSHLPINVIAYSNEGVNKVTANYFNGATDELIPIFRSPCFMNTVSLSLINAMNATHYTEDAHLAAYYKIKYESNGTTEVPKRDADGKILYEAVSMNSLAVFSCDTATFNDTENFFILFILPYEVYDSKITLK